MNRATISAGQQAWESLRDKVTSPITQTWRHWGTIAPALRELQQQALAEAQTNRATGRRFAQAMGKLLKLYRFDEIDKGTRSRLLEYVDRWDEIDEWLEGVETTRRLKWCHPATVVKNWRQATGQVRPRKKTSSKDRIVELEAEVERLKEERVAQPFDEVIGTAATWPPEEYRTIADLDKESELLTKLFHRLPDATVNTINVLRLRGTDLRDYAVMPKQLEYLRDIFDLRQEISGLRDELYDRENEIDRLEQEIVRLKKTKKTAGAACDSETC